MIVATMTAIEVVRDATRDLPAIERKFLREKEKLMRRHTKGDRKAVLEEIHAYEAPSGNNWFIVLRCSKAGIQNANFAWYRGRDNYLRAVRVREDGLTALHYSHHVFEQYGARFAKGVLALDRLRQFFLDNYACVCHMVDPMADEVEVITSVNQGWIFGISDEDEDLVHLTTIVDHGHFVAEQHDLEKKLEFERNLGGMTPGQKAELLKKLKAAGELGDLPHTG